MAFTINGTNQIIVVLRISAYCLMNKVTPFPSSIVSAIVHSDAYHQSPLMDKTESIYVVCIGIITCYTNIRVTNDFVSTQYW